MKKEVKNIHGASELRKRAEDKFNARTANDPKTSESEAKMLLHELQVHQIELEMQNEELLQAKHAAETALDKYVELYDFAPAGFFTLDGEAVISNLNFCACVMLGTQRSKLAGSNFNLYVSQATLPAFNAFFTKASENPGIKASCEAELIRFSAPRIWARIEGVFSEREKNYFIAAIDITEQKAADEKVRAAKEKAEAASITKSLFLANMSHELRTPMNGIMGFLNLLLQSELDGEQREFAETIKSSSAHLLELINDILDFSKLEAKKLTLSRKPFDICSIIKSLHSFVAMQIGAKNLSLEYYFDPEIKSRVIGDPLRLKQVVLNLLTNAVKFSSVGAVEIKVKQVSLKDNVAKISICVSDHGIGIPPPKTFEIFEMFHQLDESHTRHTGGAGIGLSIVRGLVLLMDGTISVRSDVGKGSSFTVEIPFEVETRSPEILKNEENMARPRSEKTINLIIAEDDYISRKLISALTKNFNWNVKLVHNGAEAVALFKTGNFDAILMDGQMPVMDGFEATKLIREYEAASGGHIPIIALTALAMTEDRENFLAAGMDDYLSKPLEGEAQIFETVTRHIQKIN